MEDTVSLVETSSGVTFEDGPMTTEEWTKIHADPVVRQYFADMCKAFSRCPELQEDLLQEAWLRIGTCSPNRSRGYYMHEGFRAMNAYYQREWRSWRLVRNGRDYSHNREALRKRIERSQEKFRENVRKMGQTHK